MQPILKIDLSSSQCNSLPVQLDWERDYLGGASLAARYLYGSIDLEPLTPEAPIIFLNGPLTGTAGPAVGRFVVCGRSPLTRIWAEANCGGFWGPELRKAGYDGLWIIGKAPGPVYLWIHDSMVEFCPAGHLWGLTTYATQAAIERELNSGSVRIASIGPAGEAQIPIAGILVDHGRLAARTGMGAVLGSKNVKAIVVQGTGKVPVAKPELFAPLRSDYNHQLRSDAVSTILRELGTAGAADYFDYLGEMPKKYFQSSVFDGVKNITGASMAESILTGVSACHACVIACGRVVDLSKNGHAEQKKRKGPEYETIVGFGPNLLIDDLEAITLLGELCDLYGMDTISLSNTIGLAIKLYDEKVITREDTGGLDLRWGDVKVVEKLVHQTVRREGLGAQISQGARYLAEYFGVPDEAVQVKGLEVAYHDPRGASGMALVYATSPRGACHNQSDYFLADVGQVETSIGLDNYDRLGDASKAANVARHQDWRTLFNSLVLCYFSNIPPEAVLGLINAACDIDLQIDDMLRAGERGWILKRAINHKLGMSRKDDRLPKEFLRPYPDRELDQQASLDMDALLSAYYQARGWDISTGKPGLEKLVELGLEWLVEDLWKNT